MVKNYLTMGLKGRDFNPGDRCWLGNKNLSEEMGNVIIHDIFLKDMEI